MSLAAQLPVPKTRKSLLAHATAPFKPRLIAQKNSSGGLFWVTMRLDKKFTTLWVKKITGTQFFFENECSIISWKKNAVFRFKNG